MIVRVSYRRTLRLQLGFVFISIIRIRYGKSLQGASHFVYVDDLKLYREIKDEKIPTCYRTAWMH